MELVVAVVGPHILVVAGSIRHIAGRSVGVAEDWPLDVVLAGWRPTQQQWEPRADTTGEFFLSVGSSASRWSTGGQRWQLAFVEIIEGQQADVVD